jgi:hypothetical protein
MEDAKLTDAPERDRAEIERLIESHGGAIVLRVGDKIGSDAHEAFVAYKKANDYAEPPNDFVWIGEAALGVATTDQIDAAIRELRESREAREKLERQIAEARRGLHPRWMLWFGGVLVGLGCGLALKHGWWPSIVSFVAFGLLYTFQVRRSL